MEIPVEGLSLECTVTPPRGHLSLMHSVENLICRSIAKRGAWKVFRWWYMVSQGIQVPLCLSALAFVNGGCFHFCTGGLIHGLRVM